MEILVRLSEKMENFTDVMMSEIPVEFSVTGNIVAAYHENGISKALENAEKWEKAVAAGMIDVAEYEDMFGVDE